MNTAALQLYMYWTSRLLNSEEGQDLVEYALLVSLIALATITGVSSVATAITTVFTNISTSLT